MTLLIPYAPHCRARASMTATIVWWQGTGGAYGDGRPPIHEYQGHSDSCAAARSTCNTNTKCQRQGFQCGSVYSELEPWLRSPLAEGFPALPDTASLLGFGSPFTPSAALHGSATCWYRDGDSLASYPESSEQVDLAKRQSRLHGPARGAREDRWISRFFIRYQAQDLGGRDDGKDSTKTG